jgi:CoA:oxalate CoA-transferase
MPDQNMSPRMAGALDGVRVLDFTTVMAGPFGTRLLADLGADVVKIESFEGDQVRARPPLRQGFSAYFGHLNAGKRSIVLDLKSPEAIDIIKELVTGFDILVENFRPGVMKRLGLDYEALAQINPRLIYCSISGYGQNGPKSQDPAYAPVVHAASGFDAVMQKYQGEGAKPATNGIFIADVLAGTYAFGAIQTALYQREKTGTGQFIDVSMLEGMLGMLVFEVQAAQFPGNDTRPLHGPLKTLEGYVVIAPISARNFEQLCQATDHSEWLTDPRFATVPNRNANWKVLMSLVEEWTKTRTPADVEAKMNQFGVPCSPYRSVADVLADPQLAVRDALSPIVDGGGEFKVVNPPFKMSGTRAEARNSVAKLGQHGDEILKSDLHLNEDEIAKLKALNIVG